MVNTELGLQRRNELLNYNILNIVVNTEPECRKKRSRENYNILNIVVNTEQIFRHY